MSTGHSARVRVGTSGWHYGHWKKTYYPAKVRPPEMLTWYAKDFNTVEVNNTFYRLVPEPAAAQWRDSTPPDFLFAVKGSRFLTHMKKLRDPQAGLQKFLDRVEVLGPKLGPILFQLPPHWPVDLDRLSTFLEILPREHRYTFEFRNPTWDIGETYDLLRKHRAAYCIFDLDGYQSPVEVTADFAYVRLHGPGGKYQGSYDDGALRAWARRIEQWGLKSTYVYFDNDQAGYAPKNAARLNELLGLNPASERRSRPDGPASRADPDTPGTRRRA